MAGPGGAIFGRLGWRQWPKSPQFCQSCSKSLAKMGMGGAEVELTSLFADLRGSTTLAESIGAAAFGALINRFYILADGAIAAHDGIVERHMGDGVVGLFVPVFSGAGHAASGIAAARGIVTGVRDRKRGAWAPVGVGIATGVGYVGVVSTTEQPDDFTALGDVVNTAARLGSAAAAGEILVTRAASDAAGVMGTIRRLEVKGKSEPVDVISIVPS